MQRLVDTLVAEQAELAGKDDEASRTRHAKLTSDLTQLRGILQLRGAVPAGESPMLPPSPRASDAADRVFAAIDADGDGVITRDEFATALSAPSPLHNAAQPEPRRAAARQAAAAPPASPIGALQKAAPAPQPEPEPAPAPVLAPEPTLAALSSALSAAPAPRPDRGSPYQGGAPRTKSKLVTNFDAFWSDAAAGKDTSAMLSPAPQPAPYRAAEQVVRRDPLPRDAPSPDGRPPSPDAVAGRKLAAEVGAIIERHNIDIVAAFDSFDRDGDRTIDPAELSAGLKRVMPGLTAEQLDWLLQVCDTDHNGVIDFFEFAEQVGGMRRAAAAAESLARKSAAFWGEGEPARFPGDDEAAGPPLLPSRSEATEAAKARVAEAAKARAAQRSGDAARLAAAETGAAAEAGANGGAGAELVGEWVRVFYDDGAPRVGQVVGYSADSASYEVAWISEPAGWVADLRPEDYEVLTESAARAAPKTSASAAAARPRVASETAEAVLEKQSLVLAAPAAEPEEAASEQGNAMDAFIARTQGPPAESAAAPVAAPTAAEPQDPEMSLASWSRERPDTEAAGGAAPGGDGAEVGPGVGQLLAGSPTLQRQWDALGSADEAFSALDTDGDGVITAMEFAAAFRGDESRRLSALPPAGFGPARRLSPRSGRDALREQQLETSLREKAAVAARLAGAKAVLQPGSAQLERDRARRAAMTRTNESLMSTVSVSHHDIATSGLHSSQDASDIVADRRRWPRRDRSGTPPSWLHHRPHPAGERHLPSSSVIDGS